MHFVRASRQRTAPGSAWAAPTRDLLHMKSSMARPKRNPRAAPCVGCHLREPKLTPHARGLRNEAKEDIPFEQQIASRLLPHLHHSSMRRYTNDLPHPGGRLEADRIAGLLSFDTFGRQNSTAPGSRPGKRWTILWLENRLDCRIWSYYCDLRKAMTSIHNVLRSSSILPPEGPDLIVVGPRFTTNTYRESEPLGVSRTKWAHVPLVVMQNKMCAPHRMDCAT